MLVVQFADLVILRSLVSSMFFFFLNEVTLSDFILHQKVIIQVKIEILSKDITFIVIPSISTRVNVLKQLISNVLKHQM